MGQFYASGPGDIYIQGRGLGQVEPTGSYECFLHTRPVGARIKGAGFGLS